MMSPETLGFLVIVFSVLLVVETIGYIRFELKANKIEKLAEDLNGVFQAVIKDMVNLNIAVEAIGEQVKSEWENFETIDKDIALIQILLTLYGDALSINPDFLKRIGEIKGIKREP